MERKLTTIVCADVVGFSKMMESDEEGTLIILESCRSIIDPMTIEYGGRLFNTGGDSVLLDFTSTVNAVKFAIECQKQLQARNLQHPNLPMMTYRFGIHIGDVVIQNSNLMGDGVNIAARIEALADYGGVTMSEIVYQQVRTRIPNVNYIDLGNQPMKNISDNIKLFSVEIQGAIKNPHLKAKLDPRITDQPKNEEKVISQDKQNTNSSNPSKLLTLKSISLDRTLQNSTFEQAARFISHRDYEQATLILAIQLTKKDSKATEELLHLATNKLIPEKLFGIVIEGLEYVARYSTHEKLFQIGVLLKEGLFGKENQPKFIQFWEMSAAEYGTAQYELGKFILESPGASEHHKKQAIDWVNKAVRKKDITAAMFLGGFFSNKSNSFYNPSKAFENLWLARGWHHPNAQMQLQLLSNTLPKKDFEKYKIDAETLLDQINFEHQYDS